jgi:hypothetical protein
MIGRIFVLGGVVYLVGGRILLFFGYFLFVYSDLIVIITIWCCFLGAMIRFSDGWM